MRRPRGGQRHREQARPWRVAALLICLHGCVDSFPPVEGQVDPTTDQGLDAERPAPLTDATLAPDARRDASFAPDRGGDADATPEAGLPDGAPVDLGPADAAHPVDRGLDRGLPSDAVVPEDAAQPADAAPVADAAPPIDAEPPIDAAPPPVCPQGALWGLAEGGFCVRIQPIPTPDDWTGIWDHGAARMPDGSVRIAGGVVGDATTRSTWRYVNDAIEAGPALNREKRGFATLLRRDGQLFLFMGERNAARDGFGDREDNRTHRWHPIDAEWQENPPDKNPIPRGFAAAVQLHAPDDRVVVVGGFTDPAPQATAQTFLDDAWTEIASLQHARAAPHLVRLPPPGQRVMAFGGMGAEGPIFAPEVIDLAAEAPRWTPLLRALEGVSQVHAAVATAPNGLTYVTGGVGPDGAARRLFLAFDPNTMQWSRLPDLPAPVARHTLTALPDGRLVLMGGIRENGASRTRVLVWVPGLEAWRISRPLAAARRDHTATLLADGRILVVGGYDDATDDAVPGVEVHTIRP